MSDLPDWPVPASEIEQRWLAELAAEDGVSDNAGVWPEGLWRILRSAGATRWALPSDWGGDGLDRAAHLIRYARLAEASLCAAFILTQFDGAVRRLCAAATLEQSSGARDWLGRIRDGNAIATVGISQLTTSRRHGATALTATESELGFELNGVIPWVTSATRADVFVVGAALDDGRQVLLALAADAAGLDVRPPFELAALQASCTSELLCRAVPVSNRDVLFSPAADVLNAGSTTGTGGLETSALALGQARAALVGLADEAARRGELNEPLSALAAEWKRATADLLNACATPSAATSAQVRTDANSLVLRASQAYLAARKGSGFLREERAQRYARQALFFLVWSCPTPVANAILRDLAGVCEQP